MTMTLRAYRAAYLKSQFTKSLCVVCRSPQHGAAEAVEIAQAGRGMRGKENVHQVRGALLDAQFGLRGSARFRLSSTVPVTAAVPVTVRFTCDGSSAT